MPCQLSTHSEGADGAGSGSAQRDRVASTGSLFAATSFQQPHKSIVIILLWTVSKSAFCIITKKINIATSNGALNFAVVTVNLAACSVPPVQVFLTTVTIFQ